MATELATRTNNASVGDEQHQWAALAQRTWLNGNKSQQVSPEFIEDQIWDPLQSIGFDFRSLALLESLQLLEYLWNNYDESSTNHHVLLIGFMVTVKRQQDLPIWEVFNDEPGRFSSLFHRLLSLALDSSVTIHVRESVLSFVIVAFQSLDSGLIRRECAPLVSISIWHNLSSSVSREAKFEEHGQLRKAWRAAIRRYDAVDGLQQAKLRFERAWLFTLLVDFISKLYNDSKGS